MSTSTIPHEYDVSDGNNLYEIPSFLSDTLLAEFWSIERAQPETSTMQALLSKLRQAALLVLKQMKSHLNGFNLDEERQVLRDNYVSTIDAVASFLSLHAPLLIDQICADAEAFSLLQAKDKAFPFLSARSDKSAVQSLEANDAATRVIVDCVMVPHALRERLTYMQINGCALGVVRAKDVTDVTVAQTPDPSIAILSCRRGQERFTCAVATFTCGAIEARVRMLRFLLGLDHEPTYLIVGTLGPRAIFDADFDMVSLGKMTQVSSHAFRFSNESSSVERLVTNVIAELEKMVVRVFAIADAETE